MAYVSKSNKIMDRDLPISVIETRRKKMVLYTLVPIFAFITIIYFTKRSIEPAISLSKFQIAETQIGTIENTINASGEVIPASEQNIVSPISANIQRVIVTVGKKVNVGERVIELDKSFVLLELERLKDMLALKQNDIVQLQMKLEKELYDARIADQIKSLSINRFKADIDYTRKLEMAGGSTKEDIKTAENSLRIAELEKRQLENEVTYSTKSMEAKLIDSKLQARIQNKNVQELEQKLNNADITIKQPGVVTWINDQIGSNVAAGDIVAKVANLNSFNIEGSCSDLYLDQVKPGLEVIARVSETELRGIITQIRPSIKNSVINFAVELDNKSDKVLRPNMKVELFIITNQNKKALRVKNGPAFKGKLRQSIFTIKDGEAIKKEIEIGNSNASWVEIKKGLSVGEKVIISKMDNYDNADKISIRQ